MKGIRYRIGQLFLDAEDKRFENSLSMPMETAEQRENAYSYRRGGLSESEYQSIDKLSHAYAQKRAYANKDLYAWHYGVRFRWEMIKSTVCEMICFMVSPYKDSDF